jgi:hypothetical protein
MLKLRLVSIIVNAERTIELFRHWIQVTDRYINNIKICFYFKKDCTTTISLSYIGTVNMAADERLKRRNGMTNKNDTNMDARNY